MSIPSTRAPQRPRARAGDENNYRASFAKELEPGELLTGTPTVVEQTTSDLTISNVKVSTVSLTIKGITTAIGAAVQFHALGFKTGVSYDLLVTAVTDSTPAQTKNRLVTVVTD